MEVTVVMPSRLKGGALAAALAALWSAGSVGAQSVPADSAAAGAPPFVIADSRDTASRERGPVLGALSLGLTNLAPLDGRSVQIGVSLAQLRPTRIGPDGAFAVSLFWPSIHARVGIALPLELGPGLLLLPSAGMSASGWTVGGSSTGITGFGGDYGATTGVAIVVLTSRQRGVRVGLSRHSFQREDSMHWLLEVGFADASSRSR